MMYFIVIVVNILPLAAFSWLVYKTYKGDIE